MTIFPFPTCVIRTKKQGFCWCFFLEHAEEHSHACSLMSRGNNKTIFIFIKEVNLGIMKRNERYCNLIKVKLMPVHFALQLLPQQEGKLNPFLLAVGLIF